VSGGGGGLESADTLGRRTSPWLVDPAGEGYRVAGWLGDRIAPAIGAAQPEAGCGDELGEIVGGERETDYHEEEQEEEEEEPEDGDERSRRRLALLLDRVKMTCFRLCASDQPSSGMERPPVEAGGGG
jgi:hypothetical protein